MQASAEACKCQEGILNAYRSGVEPVGKMLRFLFGARDHRSRKSEISIIGKLHSLLFGAVLHHRHDRAKSLVPHDLHVVRNVRQNGGTHIQPATEILDLAARSNFGPLAHRVVEMILYDGRLPFGNERADLAPMGIGIIQLDAFGFLDQGLDEGVVNFALAHKFARSKNRPVRCW